MCLKVHVDPDKLKRIQMILSEVVTYEVIKLMVWTDIKVTECPGDCDQLLKLFIDKIKNLTPKNNDDDLTFSLDCVPFASLTVLVLANDFSALMNTETYQMMSLAGRDPLLLEL